MCLFNRAQDLFSTTLSWIHFFSGMQRARLSKCTEKFRHLRMTGSYCPWVLLVACLCAWWNLVISIKGCVIRVCRGLGACSLSLVFPFLLNEMIYSSPACLRMKKPAERGTLMLSLFMKGMQKVILTWNGIYACLPLTIPTVKLYPAIAPWMALCASSVQ